MGKANGHKKNIAAAVLIITAVISTATIYSYSISVDTMYATNYAQVFGSYDIEKADCYLNEDTLLTYNGVTGTYKELRDNVLAAFAEKEYKMSRGYSYGHGNNLFSNGVQIIGIMAYVDSAVYSSSGVSMVLKRHWFVHYKIKAITSDDDFFGYLFFGIKRQ